MFNSDTVMVVGAGASAEAELPTGFQLKGIIADSLRFRLSSDPARKPTGDLEILEALRRYADLDGDRHLLQAHIDAGLHISEAMPGAKSIDHFLNSHRGNRFVERCGKLAIAKAILQAEGKSKMFVPFGNQHSRLELGTLADTWYLKLAELLFSCRLEEMEWRLSHLTFVVFNYDRCIEHFLLWGIRIYFGLDEKEAAVIVNKVKIFHPYGVVGCLPWQGKGNPTVGFGAKQYDLAAVASQIKTFTEGTDPDASDIVDLRKAMCRAQTVIFLGFGFHRLNMDVIAPMQTKKLNHQVRYYGTASGLSNPNRGVAEQRIRGLSPVDPETLTLQDLRCHQLFDEHSFSLDEE